MKPLSALTVMGLLVAVMILLTDTVDGGRGRRKSKQCVYRRKGEKGGCNPKTGSLEVTYHLKLKASHQGFTCPPVKIKTRRCPGCIYPKKSVPFGQCVDGHMTKVIPLGPGSRSECPANRIITRKCRGRRAGRKRASVAISKRCKYVNKEWSECNEATNTRQRVKVLLSGHKSCLPKKMLTKKCRKACRYIKGEWSECDEANMKNRTLEPKPGSLPQCESKIEKKTCFYGANSRTGKATKCRYRFGEWDSCDSRTDTMTLEMSLRSGDPNLCQRTVKLTRKCKKACKFRRGEWSKCNKMTRLMTRVDTLAKGDPKQCAGQREITKKCRKAKCKYTLGPWSDCSPDTSSRTRIKTLVTDRTGSCKKEIAITKSCIGKDGKARCFFGSWGEFGPCTNGVMTKQRPLLQGGMECERKAVTTKACED